MPDETHPTQTSGSESETERLARLGILRLRAGNPGPLTLSGTNTWIVGRDPAYVIDPGPALEEHLRALVEAVDARGGLGGVALTHGHPDHREALEALLRSRPAPLAAGAGEPDVRLRAGTRFGPLEALPTPGHAPDHFAFLDGRACFTGDAVLGEGSVFVAPGRGALRGYLEGLERLRERSLEVLCPGHGPAIWDPKGKLDAYIAHRLARERELLAALDRGLRTPDELVDAVWGDLSPRRRPVAVVTLVSHLDKLAEEGRLPDDLRWSQ
jgi:glyoxylase-like metal-dependent hydrolase (beta-lactamase superfamily II)